jgi:hypothetical protein
MRNCPDLENLALYAGDDLGQAETSDMRAHIEQCPSCLATLTELRADRNLLQTSPEIPEGAFGEVRHRVLSQLQSTARVRRYAWVAAIAACLALVAIIPKFAPKRIDPPAAIVIPPPAIVQPRVAAVNEPSRLHHKSRPVHKIKAPVQRDEELIAAFDKLFEPEAPPATSADAPVVITMQTADPNVTIILLADNTRRD